MCSSDLIYMIQDKKSDKIMIVAPIKNSPAEKAGVQAGDLILAVDGQECTCLLYTSKKTSANGTFISRIKWKSKNVSK